MSPEIQQLKQERAEEKERQKVQQLEAGQTQQEDTLNREEDKAAADDADGVGGVNAVIEEEEGVTDTGDQIVAEERAVAETVTAQQQQIHQDQVAVKNVEGLMMQKKGIDMQINSKLQGVQFDETMGQVFSQEIKGSLEKVQQSCQQLAEEVKTGVEQVPGVVRGFARAIKTHERQDSGRYTLSERGDNIEKMVLKQVDLFAGKDAELGKKIYANCKEEIHHEVGQLINNEQEEKTLDEIKEKEAKKDEVMDKQDAVADQKEEKP